MPLEITLHACASLLHLLRGQSCLVHTLCPLRWEIGPYNINFFLPSACSSSYSYLEMTLKASSVLLTCVFIFKLSLLFRVTSLSVFKDQMHTRFVKGSVVQCRSWAWAPQLGQFPGLWLKEKISYSGENKSLQFPSRCQEAFYFQGSALPKGPGFLILLYFAGSSNSSMGPCGHK